MKIVISWLGIDIIRNIEDYENYDGYTNTARKHYTQLCRKENNRTKGQIEKGQNIYLECGGINSDFSNFFNEYNNFMKNIEENSDSHIIVKEIMHILKCAVDQKFEFGNENDKMKENIFYPFLYSDNQIHNHKEYIYRGKYRIEEHVRVSYEISPSRIN